MPKKRPEGILLAWRTIERVNPDVTRPPRQYLTVGFGTINGGGASIHHSVFMVEAPIAKQMGVDMDNFPLEPTAVRINLEVVG